MFYYLKDDKHNIPMGYIQFNSDTDTIIEGRGTNILKCYQGCGFLEEMTILMFEEAKKEGFKIMYTYASEKLYQHYTIYKKMDISRQKNLNFEK